MVEHAGKSNSFLYLWEIVLVECEKKLKLPEGQRRGAAVHVDHLETKIHIN